jgi:YhcH/YjgK/YiaL family protein
MAIYGKWDECAAQVGPHAGFQAAFDFVRKVVDGTHEAAGILADLPAGAAQRYDLDGDQLYAMLIHAAPKPRAEQQMEAHQRYADVQVLVSGHEAMEVAPVDGLTVTSPFDASKDAALYAMPAEASTLLMDDGDCVVLFPTDAHAPGQARGVDSQTSRRVVVKVRDPLSRENH